MDKQQKTRAQLLTEIEQLRAEVGALRSREASPPNTLKSVLDQSYLVPYSDTDRIYYHDLDMICVYFSGPDDPSWTIPSPLGFTPMEIFPEPSALKITQALQTVLETGRTDRYELGPDTDDKEVIFVERVFPLKYEDRILGAVRVRTDITKRSTLLNELRRSEALKSAIVDHSPIGISIRSTNGTLLLANRAWREIWNISEEAYQERLKPRPKLDFNDRDSYLLEHQEAIKKVYTEGGSYMVPEVKPLKPRPGKAEWLSQFFYAITSETGKVEMVVIITENITKRKQSERELIQAKELAEENETRFKALHNASFGGIAIHDKGLILDCNQGLSAISGYSLKELIGMDGLQLIAPAYRDFVMSKIVAQDERPYEAMGIRKDGSEYPLRLEAREIPYRGKRVRVVEFRDITEQRQAEEQLRQSEIRLQNMISNSRDALGVSLAGVHTLVNDAYVRLFGYTAASDLLGKPILDLIAPSEHEKIAQYVRNRNAGEKVPNFYETIGRRADGSEFSMEVAVSTYLLNEKLHTFVIIRDLTERKRLESERLDLINQLHQSQKLEAVGTMVGGVAHELNNILQSIFLQGDMIKSKLTDNVKVDENFELIMRDAERARDIVRQILTFSRRSMPQLNIHALDKLVSEAVNLQRASLSPSIKLELSVEPNLGAIRCDPTQIHQIIVNLCNNAQQAMPEGGVLSISLKEASDDRGHETRPGRQLELIIQDTGVGIPEKYMQKIFDPFFTTKEVGQGTGLGLSVVHGIVEMIGGSIEVESKSGQGTRFILRFPQTTEPSMAAPEPLSTQETTESFKHVLLVDDEESIRIATQNVLKRRGFNTDIAVNGFEALDMVKESPDKYDVIVTDLTMPGMSGAELARKIRQVKPRVPIILSTGELGVENMESFREIGIQGFLQKPWSAREFITCLKGIETI